MKKKNSTVEMINELSSSNLDPNIKNELINTMINNNPEENEGMLDKIFGKRHPDLYIAWFIALCILLIGGLCSYLFRSNVAAVKELWQIFTPALTLVIGYVLGNKKEK